MGNSNENLKVLTPNDSQQTLTGKSNFNFSKLQEMIGLADIGTAYTLLPGTKGDTGIPGVRGSIVYNSTNSPDYSDNVDPIYRDINYDSSRAVITMYDDTDTIPEWVELIDIQQLVIDQVATISLEGALAIFVDDSDLIVYPGVNESPYVSANEKTVFLNNFDIRNNFITEYDKFKNAVLTLYIDNYESKWNLIIGSTPESGTTTLPNIDNTLKIKLSNDDSFDITSAYFDLSYIDPANSEKYTGFIFKTTNYDSVTPSNSTQTQILFGSGEYLNKVAVSYDSGVNGLAINSLTKNVQIGLLDSTNAAIYTNATNIKFNSNILPSTSGSLDLGSTNNTFRDLYVSRYINGSNLFIGENATIEGISYNDGKVGINALAEIYTNALTVNGNLDFVFSPNSYTTISTTEPPTAATYHGNGMGIYLFGGVGAEGSGGNDASAGGNVYIKGGTGGAKSTSSNPGSGGNVYVSGGEPGTGSPEPVASSVILGTDTNHNKISNVGVHTENEPVHGFEIGNTFGVSVYGIDSSSSSGNNSVIYAIDTLEGPMTFTISSDDQVPGRIIIIKDCTGNCSPTNTITIMGSDGAIVDMDTGTQIVGVKMNDSWAYIQMFYRDVNGTKLWHVISHYGIDFN